MEIQIGETYFCNETNGTYWISKCVKKGKYDNLKDSLYISNMNGARLEFRTSDPSYCGRSIRLATAREKLWLDTCIKADEFIPLDQILEPEPFYIIY